MRWNKNDRTREGNIMSNVGREVDSAIGTKKPRGRLAKLAPKPVDVPSSADPRIELVRLVRQHKNWTRKSVAIQSMASDRKNLTTGEVLKCDLPDDRRADFLSVAKALKNDASKLESAMMRELRKIPVYTEFLAHVYGVGPVVSAYLIAEIDIRKTEKVSGLHRFAGLAVINGRLERPARGQRNAYNQELRTRLYQAMSAMWKNAAKRTADAPHGVTSKYLTIWTDYKHRMQHSVRFDAAKNTLLNYDGEGVRKGARSVIHSTGWHKAADVFIEDLYVVWRTLEGLNVWPSYHAAKLGYSHGGKVCVNAPRFLTVDEAKSVVGNVGSTPRTAPVADAGEVDDEPDDVDALDEQACEAAQ